MDFGRRMVTVRVAKNGQPRDVPLTRRATTALADLKAKRTITLSGPQRVFSWIPEQWPGHLAKDYKRAVKAAELPPLRLHDLRHLAAVNLVRSGTPLPDVAKLLGHKTLAMTWRYARHTPGDSALLARDRLEAYLETGESAERSTAIS